MAKRNEKEIVVARGAKNRTMLGGVLLGGLAGVTAAYLLTRRAERQERENTLTPMEAIKIGLLVFGLLRAIAALGDDD